MTHRADVPLSISVGGEFEALQWRCFEPIDLHFPTEVNFMVPLLQSCRKIFEFWPLIKITYRLFVPFFLNSDIQKFSWKVSSSLFPCQST